MRDDDRRSFLSSAVLELPEVVHGFSTRAGGVSNGTFRSLAPGHRLRDSDALRRSKEHPRQGDGAQNGCWATVDQVHGDEVVQVKGSPTATFARREADALITNVPGWLLGVRTADCVPVLIAGRRTVAAVHAGWRGTAASIVSKVVSIFEKNYGVPARDLKVAVGPAIGLECYEVGDSVAESMTRALDACPGGWLGVVVPASAKHSSARDQGSSAECTRRAMAPGVDARTDRWYVDLKEANRRLLEASGVAPENIGVLPHCTSCESSRFFSYRREGGETGRMMNFIGISPVGYPEAR